MKQNPVKTIIWIYFGLSFYWRDLEYGKYWDSWLRSSDFSTLHSSNIFLCPPNIFSSYQYHRPPRPRSRVVNYRQVEKKILDEILGAKVYDTRLRPQGHGEEGRSGGATIVHVNIFVRDFSAISDVGMVSGGWREQLLSKKNYWINELINESRSQ